MGFDGGDSPIGCDEILEPGAFRAHQGQHARFGGLFALMLDREALLGSRLRVNCVCGQKSPRIFLKPFRLRQL